MYIRNGQVFNIDMPNLLGDNRYPPGWFAAAAERDAFGIIEVATPIAPAVSATQKVELTGFSLVASTWVPQWLITNKSQAELDAEAAALAAAKVAKNLEINAERQKANQTYFTHSGKKIACDQLSRSDIDGVANNIALTGVFPAGFPNAWRATDNTYISLPDVAAFKAMYASMTQQGSTNFSHSQSLKTTLTNATTVTQVNAIVW
jgi:hypothetical protein